MFRDHTDTWNGAVHCTKNARVLFDAAEALRIKEQVGCAAALLVLSAEESSKAIGLGQHITSPLPAKNLQQLFRKHIVKHHGAATVAHVLLAILRLHPTRKPLAPGEGGLYDHIEHWRKNADTLKKRGFYVDYVEGQWVHPGEIVGADYDEAKVVAHTILTVAEGFFKIGTLEELISHDHADEA